MDVVLLLTGCIKPNVTDKLYYSNPEVRRKQYVNAIQWYLDNTPYKIIFAENSGTDISCEFVGYKHRTEFLTWYSAPTVPDRSRSYKEMEILEYVDTHSKILPQMEGIIVKITGRLLLLNIMTLTEYIVSLKSATIIQYTIKVDLMRP